MYEITIPQRINQITTIFRLCGMWRQKDEIISRKMMWKLIYLIFYVSFLLSVALGGFLSDDKNECIYLISLAVGGSVLTVKLIYILWKKEEILVFLQDIGVHSAKDREEFTQIKKKVDKFVKFISCFILLVLVYCIVCLICLPLLSSEKILPLNVAFPLGWRKSKIVYWMAYAFVTAGFVISFVSVMLNIVIWYLMMNCSIKYKILANQYRNMGSISTKKPTDKETRKITEVQKQKLFSNELIGLIKVHQNIQETINRFKSCFSHGFFAQITTSGICICGSVYVLAFSSNDNLIQSGIYGVVLVYNLFDIFMVMYLGNEIKLSSDRLSYCLFESNWMDQSQPCKKCVIILVEVLKQPHQLIICKLYPLDLETFIAILNLAYSMFNLLRNFN